MYPMFIYRVFLLRDRKFPNDPEAEDLGEDHISKKFEINCAATFNLSSNRDGRSPASRQEGWSNTPTEVDNC